ncbi:hypothetical protein [Treponema brennaborense]|uniref:Lipoprotein n=1 Tax=Treponema brennaborense (strain DSM 12168 / CIP 105900 / DD5/3) TaxID=906968 RepID=F4LPW1_TREBD|nr:hypothetical protein [Treponema brennaborense]AEE16053.1 hypothetical protein Trebr_0611 [Treponema brennaborense DSM 12168]
MKRRFFPEIIVLFFLVFGCSQGRSDFSQTEHTVHFIPEPATAHDTAVVHAPRPFPEPVRRIAVLFGYGYNDDAFVSSALEKLRPAFGLVQDGGAVIPLVFPDDFKRGGTARISALSALLEANGADGLVLLGAPEGTHAALARMQDAGGGSVGYPVFSLLPQDDLLGMEAGCDLVLEYMPAANEGAATAEETSVFVSGNIPDLLVRAVGYLSLFPQDAVDLSGSAYADLLQHARQLTGSEWTVTRYVDPETGLRPVNHFVIEQH